MSEWWGAHKQTSHKSLWMRKLGEHVCLPQTSRAPLWSGTVPTTNRRVSMPQWQGAQKSAPWIFWCISFRRISGRLYVLHASNSYQDLVKGSLSLQGVSFRCFHVTLEHTGTHTNTHEHTTTHCNTPPHTAASRDLSLFLYRASLLGAFIWHCNTLENTATRCNTSTHTATFRDLSLSPYRAPLRSIRITLQQTATNCNMLQHIATHCNTLQHQGISFSLYRGHLSQGHSHCAATHCNTLQHAATCCNPLQHTATSRDLSFSLQGISFMGIHITLQRTATHCNTL